MKKLLVLVFVVLMTVSCAEVKRPGMQLSATLDYRAVKMAADPNSDYMGYFGKLIDKNKDAYFSCDADGACTYAGSGTQSALQHGIVENLASYGVVVKITQGKKPVKEILVLAKGYVATSLMPGSYEYTINDEKSKKVLGQSSINVNLVRADAVSKITEERVDFRIGWNP